ncbi:MAG: protein-disulfide isomerase [Candidatus Nanohaloarchaea archaeon]|jgi:protein-disulfide isomerase
MVECDFCGEKFDNKARMHVHWGEKHEDELNSHQKEKVKKAERIKEEEKSEVMARRKRLAGYGLGGTLTVLLLGFLLLQVMQNTGGGLPQQESFELQSQPVLGASENTSNDTIQIVEFGDYRCHHCQSFDMEHKPQLVEDYIENEEVDVEFYWINTPILGPQSETAAIASECVVDEAGRNSQEFWNFHSAMFENPNINYNADALTQVARDSTSGLDYDSINSCISNRESQDAVEKDMSIAQGNNVTSTPTIFVNDERMSGYDASTISSSIERKLN